MTLKKLLSYAVAGLATLALLVALPGCPKSDSEKAASELDKAAETVKKEAKKAEKEVKKAVPDKK